MNWRRLFQFRISTLLWLLTVVAVGIGSYRKGLDEQLARQRQGTLYIRYYKVKDLVYAPGMAKPDFDPLLSNLSPSAPKNGRSTAAQDILLATTKLSVSR